MAKTVKARWVGPFVGELPDKTVLIPGETEVEIPAGEAEDSDNWEPVGAPSSAPEPAAPAEGSAPKGGKD